MNNLALNAYAQVLPCFVHLLNTTVGERCSYGPAKKAMQLANRIVSFFNGSHFWGGQLKDTAKSLDITHGLKKNCESRWYALILLAVSVQAHRVPLSTLVACPDARCSHERPTSRGCRMCRGRHPIGRLLELVLVLSLVQS